MQKYRGDPFAGPRVLENEPPASLGGGVAIVWFRNDLRVRDHDALALANTAEVIVPLYVLDRAAFGMENASPWGFQRTGPFRAVFMLESVRDLRNSLRLKGADMVFKVGDPVGELVALVKTLATAGLGPVHVVAHKEVTKEETDAEFRVQTKLADLEKEGLGVEAHWVWGGTLHHLSDLPFNAGGPALPATFTEYRKLIESQRGAVVRPETEMPERFKPFPLHLMLKSDQFPSLREDLRVEGLTDPLEYAFPDPRAVIDFRGGLTAGEDRIDDYIWKKEALRTYKETRNGSGTMDFSSKFSPWLALGCISPRTIYWNCKRFEEQVVANESTYWMVFELITRDYFRWVAASVGTKLFTLNGYSRRSGDQEHNIWSIDTHLVKPIHRERLQKWIDGSTGAPFVDTNMRELAATGFMSNRGRQNVASFLIHDLEFPDWRAGAEYFESLLIDHDVASNWGNWAYLAGVGSDPRGGRRFNVVKQSMDYDKSGWFIKRWCPELTEIPPPMIHEPHLLSSPELEDFNIVPGETYPKPIVELARGSRH